MQPLSYKTSQLCKGIFWITDQEDIYSNKLVFLIPVDNFGNIDPSVDRLSLNSKNHDNYNHKKVWDSLNSKDTHNKSFDYYPRGRVEIANSRATIYASPHLCTDAVIEWVKDTFNLTEQNGIKRIRFVADHSDHYLCCLDSGS